MTTNFVSPNFRTLLVAWLGHNHSLWVYGGGVRERKGASENRRRKFFLISSNELKKKGRRRREILGIL
jgi:hypothetical protein